MFSLSCNRLRFLALAALISLFLSACEFQKVSLVPQWPGWTYSELRSLDSIDSLNPDLELVALYTRQIGRENQIRLDLLELNQDSKFELLLALDTQPGGNPAFIDQHMGENIKWDVLIRIGSNNNLETKYAAQGLKVDRLRVVRNPDEDTIIISFFSDSNIKLTSNQSSIMTWLRHVGGKEAVDSIGPVKLAAPPPQQVNVVLYFWNTFAAATPAQALRSWDGAHSGPGSYRHGLYHLIKPVEENQVPVILSDLNTPQNLSGLEYLAALNQVREIAASGLIGAPDVSPVDLSDQPAINVPDMVYEKGLNWSHQVSRSFLMPVTQVLVASQWPSTLGFPPAYGLILPPRVPPLSTARVCTHGQVRLLCQVDSPAGEATEDPYFQLDQNGLSIQVKKKLINTAISGNGALLFMGGDFGHTPWGDPFAPYKALGYLHSHPWIRVLSLNDFRSWMTVANAINPVLPETPTIVSPFVPEAANGQPILSGLDTAAIHDQVLDKLKGLPKNGLSEGLWQWYFTLLASRGDIQQHRLNAATLGQLGHLIAAARWAEKPYTLAGCSQDLDWDGENECVLASEDTFASFEMQGGALIVGLHLDPDGVSQFIAPTYQVFNGVADPFLWKTEEGFAGDPDAVGGAFLEQADVVNCCSLGVITNSSIEFLSLDMAMRKIYSISSSSLEVKYSTSSITVVSGMLVDNPWDRFYPQWADKYLAAGTSADQPGAILPNLRITSSTELSDSLFAASRGFLTTPEDPNFDYGAGHQLLFPFGTFTVTGNGDFWIRLEWR